MYQSKVSLFCFDDLMHVVIERGKKEKTYLLRKLVAVGSRLMVMLRLFGCRDRIFIIAMDTLALAALTGRNVLHDCILCVG